MLQPQALPHYSSLSCCCCHLPPVAPVLSLHTDCSVQPHPLTHIAWRSDRVRVASLANRSLLAELCGGMSGKAADVPTGRLAPLDALLASEPSHRPVLTALLQFLNQRDVARLFAVSRSLSASLRSLLPSNSVWVNLDLQESVRAGSVLSHCGRVVSLRGSVRRLCLFLCGRLTDSECALIAQFSQLTSVDVGGCHGLTDEAMMAISAPRQASTGGQRRALQWLSLYWCPGLTDKGITHLSAGLDCAALRHLSLSGVRHASDSALMALLDQCTNLTHLDLTRVERMTDDTLVSLSSSCSRLTTLLLYADSQLTDIGLRAVARGCHSLRHIDLTGLSKVTDAAITELAAGAPLVETLTLQWCTPITDDSVRAIGQHCSRLTALSLHGCRLLTLDGLRSLAALPRLRALDVNGIPAAKRADVRALFTEEQHIQLAQL